MASRSGEPRIRVLHVITSLYRGGAENHLLILAKAIDASQFDFSVAYMQAYDDLAEDFRAINVPVYPLAMQRWLDPQAIWRLAQIIRQGQYDIIHSHLYPADLYVYLASKLVAIPAWISSHHNAPRFFERRIHQWLCRLMARKQYALISISDAVKRYIQQQCHIDPAHIHTIHYGLAAEDFKSKGSLESGLSRRDLGLSDDDFVLAIVARLVPQKGHTYAIEAVKQLVEQLPTLKLLIIGGGTLEEVLRTQAHTSGLDSHIVFLGQRADVANVLSLIDVMLLPSLYEGFGLVLLEAMALAKPIIASNVGPIPEIVIDHETGLLVPSANSQALAEAIRTLYAAPALRKQMGQQGYERLKQHFTADSMANATEELYKMALSATKRGASTLDHRTG